MSDKKLFLLDAYALIFRAYYAFINRPITNSKGLNTSAIFGFVNSMEEILQKENPTHLAVVFDPAGPTFRKELFKEYKANRAATPDDIKLSIPYIKRIIEAYNIPIVEVPNYEADDVIGTIAKVAANDGFEVYMMTPDKDYGQLVDENIFIYKPRRGGEDAEIIGTEEILDKYGIEKPEQVIDILALWGDASDNVPGAPGIGEKTSMKLVKQFHSVEQLLDSTDQLKGKQKENLENFREQVLLSKKLVTIVTDVNIELDWENLIIVEKDKTKLKALFDELEFANLTKRILGDIKPQVEAVQGDLFGNQNVTSYTPLQNSFDLTKVKYELIDTTDGLKSLVKEIQGTGKVCIDTETTSLNVFEAKLLGISIALKEKEAYYISINDSNRSEFIDILSNVFTIEKQVIIGHNLKYDLQILINHGITVQGILFDTMIAHYLLYPNSKHKLDEVSIELFDYHMIPITDLIGKKGKSQRTMESVPIETAKDYACEDADLTLQIYNKLYSQLSDNELNTLVNDIEMPLVGVLTDVELAGFRIDTDSLQEVEKEFDNEIVKIQDKIYKLAGEEFNIASPKQLGIILFEKLKITSQVTLTKSKQYSTSEETLTKLTDKHDIVPLILEYRSLTKLQSTYITALPKLVQQQTGKIHTSFNQAVTATGRLSSLNPNLQNIPIRDDRGRIIRKAFVPSKGYTLLAADYSQIELRIMAHLSEDEGMIEAFLHGADIHQSTAAKVFKVSPEEVTRDMRSKAKTANFGIIYGISAFGLSQRLNITRSEAKELIDNYFETFPKVKEYMDLSIENAKQHGYVTTLFGRKRYLPEINSANANMRGFAARNAINTPIQGTAADIIKLAMVHIDKEIKEQRIKSKMILQVHDELIFDVIPEELELLKSLVKEKMEGVIGLKVPLTVEVGVGDNWLEAH